MPILPGEARDGSGIATDIDLFRPPTGIAARVENARNAPYPGDRLAVGTR